MREIKYIMISLGLFFSCLVFAIDDSCWFCFEELSQEESSSVPCSNRCVGEAHDQCLLEIFDKFTICPLCSEEIPKEQIIKFIIQIKRKSIGGSLSLIQSGFLNQQIEGLESLGELIYHNKKNQDQIRESGGVFLLIDLLQSSNPLILSPLIKALSNFVYSNPENQACLQADTHVIRLASFFKDSRRELVLREDLVLFFLNFIDSNKQMKNLIINHGIVPWLIFLLKNSKTEIQIRALEILTRLSSGSSFCQQVLGTSDLMNIFETFSQSLVPDINKRASIILKNLALTQPHGVIIPVRRAIRTKTVDKACCLVM